MTSILPGGRARFPHEELATRGRDEGLGARGEWGMVCSGG